LEPFGSAKHNFGIIIFNDSFENAKQKFLMHKKDKAIPVTGRGGP
jgi:hypothetical protein